MEISGRYEEDEDYKWEEPGRGRREKRRKGREVRRTRSDLLQLLEGKELSLDIR